MPYDGKARPAYPPVGVAPHPTPDPSFAVNLDTGTMKKGTAAAPSPW